jgi:hypothetical protein
VGAVALETFFSLCKDNYYFYICFNEEKTDAQKMGAQRKNSNQGQGATEQLQKEGTARQLAEIFQGHTILHEEKV